MGVLFHFSLEPLGHLLLSHAAVHPLWFVFGTGCILEVGRAIAEAVVAEGKTETVRAVFVLVPWWKERQVRS